MDLHLEFHIGNVVRWCGDLYIVSKIFEDAMVLIPFAYSNSASHPSTTWPHLSYDPDEPGYGEPDPTKTVDTVEFVASCIKALIVTSVWDTINDK